MHFIQTLTGSGPHGLPPALKHMHLLIVCLLSAVVVTGCDVVDDDDDDPPATSSTIVEVADAQGYDTLETAIGAAGLTGTLSGDGPFTVFAPTDQAFADLEAEIGSDAYNALLADPAALGAILQYHVLGSAVDASTASGLDSATTLQGSDLIIDQFAGALHINESTVIAADVMADNGIIHGIDTVLRPPQDIPTTLDERGFDTLVTAVGVAGLGGTLSGPGPFTVFAPTDAAFAALPAGTLDALLADPAALAEVLLYHVVGDEVVASEVIAASSLTTAEGSDVVISTGGGVFVDAATVTVTNIPATNGVIHVIDAVLTPPGDG